MQEKMENPELLPQVASSSISTDVKELFQKGISFYKYADFESAKEVFSSITNTNPDFIEAQINLGNVFFKQNKYSEAVNCWKKALSKDPSHINCYINLGNACYAMGNKNEAITHWQAAIAIVPDYSTALMNLGAVYEEKNNLLMAYKYYEMYLMFCPKNKSAEYKRIFSKVNHVRNVAFHNLKVGLYFQKRDDFKNAMKAYLKSVKTYPNFAKAYLNLGSICYKLENYEATAKFWKRALIIDPSYESSICNLGIVYDKLKQPDNAYCMYNRYLKINRFNSYESNEIKHRAEELKLILEKSPEKARKHLEKAEEYFKNKFFQEALWEYENYIILNPESENAYMPKIMEIKDVLNPIKKAVKTAMEIGQKFMDQKQYEKAIQAYKRCIHLENSGEFSELAFKKITECSKLIQRNKKSLVNSTK